MTSYTFETVSAVADDRIFLVHNKGTDEVTVLNFTAGDTTAVDDEIRQLFLIHKNPVQAASSGPPPSLSPLPITNSSASQPNPNTPPNVVPPVAPAANASNQTQPGVSAAKAAQKTFTLMTYNILKKGGATFNLFPDSTPGHLNDDNRRALILNTITQKKPDVLCLQENWVDDTAIAEELKKTMFTSSSPGKPSKRGVSVYFKDTMGAQNQIAVAKKYSVLITRVGAIWNVHVPSGKDPNEANAMQELLQGLEQRKTSVDVNKAPFPTLICGDFNRGNDDTYNRFEVTYANNTLVNGTIREHMQHLGYTSVYAKGVTSRNQTGNFAAMLDYIFYDATKLEVVGKQPDTLPANFKDLGVIPSKDNGSDHIPLFATFKVL